MNHVRTILGITLTVLAIADAAAEGVPPEYDLSGYEEIFDLEEQEARVRGKRLAEKDVAAGLHRVLVYGLRPERIPAEEALAEKYGIFTVPIAGCIVSEGILAFAASYNDVMKRHLERKFGSDVLSEARPTPFEEAAEEAAPTGPLPKDKLRD